jgi:hypothetical protein
MEVLLHLLYSVEYISFDEYMLFICWINTKEEIPLVLHLIEEYRNTQDKKEYEKILSEKSQELDIQDFSDNIMRFFNMLLISSYIKKEDNRIYSNLSKKDIEIVLESFSTRDFSDDGYFNYLNTNDGWKIYTINQNYLRVINSLEQKTTEEQEEIINKITGPIKLPDITNINPRVIEMEIDQGFTVEKKTIAKNRSVNIQKIDFELRDNNNRLVGDFAEKIVIKYERDELKKIGSSFVNNIKQVSLDNDSLGYDILSFDENSSEKHIEVKAVKNSPALAFKFYISENEVAVAKEDPNYHLYIVFDYFSASPLIYKMLNPFLNETPGVSVDPIKYLVTVRIKNN